MVKERVAVDKGAFSRIGDLIYNLFPGSIKQFVSLLLRKKRKVEFTRFLKRIEVKKIFKELMIKFRSMEKWEKRLLIWYIVSVSMILTEYLVNYTLDKDVYFHPYISIMINILLFIDVFLIPLILVIKDILSESKKFIIKIFQIFLSTIGLGIMMIVISFIFSMSNKSVIDSDTVDISFGSGVIYIEKSIWLESRNHIYVYRIENPFFIKLVNNL